MIMFLVLVLLAACGGMAGDETPGFSDEGQRTAAESPQIDLAFMRGSL
jgi:hypothetical protein